jgi:hypothetical protein
MIQLVHKNELQQTGTERGRRWCSGTDGVSPAEGGPAADPAHVPGRDRWATCARSGAFLYGVDATGHPMTAAPPPSPRKPAPCPNHKPTPSPKKT